MAREDPGQRAGNRGLLGVVASGCGIGVSVASSGQRNAFEGRALAGGWQIDMSARENQLVPGSLADVLITFTVSGYHDSGLRAAIDGAKLQTTALTSYLSAQQIFPDAFYDFSRTGRMLWKVSGEGLTSNNDLGRLRNIGFSLRPAVANEQFSRLMTRLLVNLRVNQDTAGNVNGVMPLLTNIPTCVITQPAPMTVQVSATMGQPLPSELTWDFGDGSPVLGGTVSGTPPQMQATGSHVYKKPGRYTLKVRCVRGEILSDFRFSVGVSRTNRLGEPLFVTLNRVTLTPEKLIKFEAGGMVQQASRILWRVGQVFAEGNSATFKLKPGNYVAELVTVRKLSFKAYCRQRHRVKPSNPIPLAGLSGTTNRTFDENGNETNGTGNPPLPFPQRTGQALVRHGRDFTGRRLELRAHSTRNFRPATRNPDGLRRT